jgi:hypothetical protein
LINLEWNTSPLLISLKENHKKCYNLILSEKNTVNIDYADSNGKTLLFNSLLKKKKNTKQFIKFLIEEKGANPKINHKDGKILY